MYEADGGVLGGVCKNCGHPQNHHAHSDNFFNALCPVKASCKNGCRLFPGEHLCRECGLQPEWYSDADKEPLNVAVSDPEAQVNALENTYADFITRECAAVGMLHASMASLVPVSQLDALSLEEQEMVQQARDLLYKVHGFVLSRADYRKQTLGRLKEVMDER